MDLASYTHVFHLPVGVAEAFELFSNPRHLDALTPSWFRLQLRGPVPAPLGTGAEISYWLRWRGIPMRWTSRLMDWQAPDRFAYEQKVGPYKYFRHDHQFTAVQGGTEVCDRALFRAPGGHLVNRLVAEPDLRRIFAHREGSALEVLRSL